MQIIRATDDLTINGMTYSGFPILVDKDLELVMPANKFLIYTLLHRGRVSRRGVGKSKERNTTWDNYGQCIYDYFSFLEARNTDWRDIHQVDGHTIVAAYRDWSVGNCKLANSTVNQRLGLIVRFYLYAMEKGWIDSLPFDFETIRISKPSGFMSHTDRSGGVVESADVMLRRTRTLLKLYPKDQAKVMLSEVTNPTHLNILRILLKVGLRKAEALTFPWKLLITPSQCKEYGSNIWVNLNPKNMITKGGVARTVVFPRNLMHQLWDYFIHERSRILVENGISGDGPETLFVNRSGKPFSVSTKSLPKNINAQLSGTGIKFKFHKCRHTYATMTLYEKNKAGHKDALMYVKDRLGHASINTTEKYLHYIEMIEDQLLDAFQQELDDL